MYKIGQDFIYDCGKVRPVFFSLNSNLPDNFFARNFVTEFE